MSLLPALPVTELLTVRVTEWPTRHTVLHNTEHSVNVLQLWQRRYRYRNDVFKCNKSILIQTTRFHYMHINIVAKKKRCCI